METKLLSITDILLAYDKVSKVYPNIPSLCIWRTWEFAAYQRYHLHQPVLDIGCGDGVFFRLAWPTVKDVVGIDVNPAAVDAARSSGVYQLVYQASAHSLPVRPQSFVSVFANCSLEHMDHLHEALDNISSCLRQGGLFLLSVVTEKFLKWSTLPLLVDQIGEPLRAKALQDEYEEYHHLVNPFPVDIWVNHLNKAGFEVLEHIPILPEMTSQLFLFLDQVWHVRRAESELGDYLYSYFASLPHFNQAFRHILSGVLQMEKDWTTGSGAIFWTRKKGKK